MIGKATVCSRPATQAIRFGSGFEVPRCPDHLNIAKAHLEQTGQAYSVVELLTPEPCPVQVSLVP